MILVAHNTIFYGPQGSINPFLYPFSKLYNVESEPAINQLIVDLKSKFPGYDVISFRTKEQFIASYKVCAGYTTKNQQPTRSPLRSRGVAIANV